MLTIIEIKDREDGGHGLQSQSHRTECWLEGWLAVPPELEQTAWDCAGYCDLDIQDGKLVGLTPRERPPKPEPEPQPPSAEERLGLLEEALAQTDETAIALFESQAAQESIDAQQDDALLDIYEMLGG